MRRRDKSYTLDEANASLPLVRAIVEDVVELSGHVIERRERLAMLRGDRDPDADDFYTAELKQTEQDLKRQGQQLQEYVEELAELGIELKNGLEGIVDFPAMVDGRLVYLCWKLGEPEVLYWHELDAGFSGRQPLTTTAVAGKADDLPESAA